MAFQTYSAGTAGIGFFSATFSSSIVIEAFPDQGKGGYVSDPTASCVTASQRCEILGFVWQDAAAGDTIQFIDDSGLPGPTFKHSTNALGLFILAPLVALGPIGATSNNNCTVTIFYRQG